MLRLKLLKKVGNPEYRSSLVTDWQNTSDIINALKKQHLENRPYAAKIAPYFCAENERETARNIFNFLKREIRYQVEPAERQTVKSLPRLLADGYGDCKHYTNFANSILEACGYKPVYRFAGYSNKGLTHTYTYLPASNTVLDAVLPSFDTEKTPKIKTDMSLYKMSGVTSDFANAPADINGINFNKLAKNVKSAAAKASNTVKKAAAQIPAAAKKVVQKTATLGLAPARAAFTGLVALNVRGLATDLKKVYDKKGRDGFSWWADMGGNRDDLLKVVLNNASKKRLLGIQEESEAWDAVYGGYSGDGVYVGEPVTIAASLAAATPILIKVADVLKAANVTSEQIKKAVDDSKSSFKQITGKDVSDVIFKKEANVTSNKLQYKASDLKPTTEADATKVATAALAYGTGTDINTIKEVVAEQVNPAKESEGGKPTSLPKLLPNLDNKTLLIGAGVVAAFFILRKK